MPRQEPGRDTPHVGPMKGDDFLHYASGELFVARGPAFNAQVIVYRKAVGPSGRDWVLSRTPTGIWKDETGHEYKHLSRQAHATSQQRAHATVKGTEGAFEQPQIVSFETWDEVLDAARRGERLWYHAPFDYRPASIRVVKVFKNGKIRIDPLSSGADNFTADEGHLNRFRKRV